MAIVQMPQGLSPIGQILAQFETKLLKAKLLELPAQIQSVKEDLGRARQELKYAEEDRVQAEAILMAAISAEMDPVSGKAKFSNDKARTAELSIRKSTDTDYVIAEKACDEMQRKVDNLQFQLEKLQDEFRSYRYVTDLTARELALYASEAVNGGSGAGSDELRRSGPVAVGKFDGFDGPEPF